MRVQQNILMILSNYTIFLIEAYISLPFLILF